MFLAIRICAVNFLFAKENSGQEALDFKHNGTLSAFFKTSVVFYDVYAVISCHKHNFFGT